MILTGFLGAGKTTFLMDLARYIIAHSDSTSEAKVAIVENEVGEIGIDDKLLSSTGLNVENLFSGCVCCTLSGSLVVTAKRIRDEIGPEWLILETTGLAYPQPIKESLMVALDTGSKTVVVVDAFRWAKIKEAMKMLLEGQLGQAEIILINKCDLVDEETAETVEADVRSFSPDAHIYRISSAEPIDEAIFEDVLTPVELDESFWD